MHISIIKFSHTIRSLSKKYTCVQSNVCFWGAVSTRNSVRLWAFKDASSNAHALPQSSQNIVRSWWNVLSLNIGMRSQFEWNQPCWLGFHQNDNWFRLILRNIKAASSHRTPAGLFTSDMLDKAANAPDRTELAITKVFDCCSQ